ncbi:DUF3514 domain-containing protein [Ehrlichia japonica]|uniref:Uncharacterized protein n=1 Tax=Ehrlichia japonica TaxID=391036 RepID=X5GKF1_9RICK|nr:DUF3514 domain-containing protein [Ehrlichia japonica]AHX04606.1 hypothetical protein EHF_0943 [Ehrlichia japonica]
MCCKFVCMSSASKKFASLVDLIVLSCVTCFGQMYHVMVKAESFVGKIKIGKDTKANCKRTYRKRVTISYCSL